jgi:iron complex transport system ATP-binding protein
MNVAPLVSLEGATVRRGSRNVVRRVTLGVAAGERVALVGPNAAGKSSLLSAMAGILPVAEGNIRLGSQSLRDFSNRDIAKRVALVAAVQETAPKLTVQESTELGRYPHSGPFRSLAEADRTVVAKAIVETGLEDLAHRSLGSLSAGERQRALIARALAQEPELLLLDEPSAHLDIGHTLDLFALLTAIASRGVAIVAVIHDLAAAAPWATRMVVLHEGRIVDDGPPVRVMQDDALGQAFGVLITEERPSTGASASTWRFERKVS